MPNFGLSFLPEDNGMDRNRPQGQPSGAPPLQQAIKLLSLRLPRVAGANALAPGPLLNAPGGGGLGAPPLQALLQRLFGPQSGPMKIPFGQMPGAGGFIPGADGMMSGGASAPMLPASPPITPGKGTFPPMGPPAPRITPGMRPGEGGGYAGPPPRFAPEPAPPSAPPQPPQLPQNPFADIPQMGGGGFTPMPTASGPPMGSAPIGQADPQEALQRLLAAMGGWNPRF